MPAPAVFISYRRSDSGGEAVRLTSRLSDRWGTEIAFLDVESIRHGDYFPLSIRTALSSASVVLVIIGPNWLGATNGDEARIHEPDDWVRKELAYAFFHKLGVLPVLVGGAKMPSSDDLPPDLEELAYINALELSDSSYDQGIERLVRAIEELVGQRHQK